MAFEQNIDAAAAVAPEDDVASAIGSDERRMHVRAYNYWCSLLDGRDFPTIQDLDPADLDDFGPHSVLLDFTHDADDPATPYVGDAIREECGLDREIVRISDVPSRSLLSRLTDHYMQIIANRAPVGFEAEFVNQRNQDISYRGILMPLSSDGEAIDFIYGVINWKNAGPAISPDTPIKAVLPSLKQEPQDALENELADESHLAWEEGPLAEADDEVTETALAHGAHLAWEDGPLAEAEDEAPTPVSTPDANSGLSEWLQAARVSADASKAAEGRSRAALYSALALAYDFSKAAEDRAEEYLELLDSAGIKAQARAPMTPIVKLVFGADYAKARLTEYAAALSYGHRSQVQAGDFETFIENAEGGLKGLVKAERAARRGSKPPVDKAAIARDKLRSVPSIGLEAVEGDEEYALVVTRRNADGSVVAIARIDDPKLIDRALVKAAR